ncbi:hypothetical protein [Bordetella genomosp. 12]|uniref:Uncharacterized protein n=1 Tax=Bordetella genomosp. 12 TaxID=463035 RepID=A0A261VX64_9BORD|nr:hypothetical protein [Bordetella genomosp. 12]OZI77893.1 hypothetical protein CAL22_05050 [Bordetella genomosp. 12]
MSASTTPPAVDPQVLGDLALNAAHIALFAMRQQKPQEALGVLEDVADSLLQYLAKSLEMPADQKAAAKRRITETLHLALAVTKGSKI